MMHLLADLDKEGLTADCSACGRRVDVYAYKSKGGTGWRCGPRSRQYRRTQYETEKPGARKYANRPDIRGEL